MASNTLPTPPGSRGPVEQGPLTIWHVAPPHVAEPPFLTVSQQRFVLRRRQLLRGGFWAGAAALAAGAVAAAAEFISPRVAPPHVGNVFRVPADQVPRPGGEPYHVLDGRFWLVNLKPGEGAPPILVGPQAKAIGEPSRRGGLLALSQRCPLHGCAIPWRPDAGFAGLTGWFRCPCCGSVFSKAGLHVFGPAGRSMDTFRIIEVSRHGVLVDTSKVLLGDRDDPQRAVPAGPFG